MILSLPAKSPMIWVLRVILVFEAITYSLAIPGQILVSKQSTLAAFGWTGAVVLCAILAAIILPRWFWFAWLVQLAGIALGLLTPMMYVVGAMFALIWLSAFWLAKRIPGKDAEKS